eukprot:TRINITY_DN69904_c0_g1_i1.p1 TRINITY_DN69904_c0_g1~~TRINITY_DN69904_c0_g1_i1.p1  ORF type:complete len:114 (+),score=22.35 TRINITY_DN69904_c0_g1_i1:228-569(+)
MADGNVLPLLGGSDVTFHLELRERQDQEQQPGDALTAVLSQERAKACAGHIPGIDLCDVLHAMVYVEEDEDEEDVIICRSSWAGEKLSTITSESFAGIHSVYALPLSDVQRRS